MSKSKQHSTVFFLYFAFFFALFLQFPLKNNLCGNYDTWIGVAGWNAHLAKLVSIFTGEYLGTYFYPAQTVAFYGETSHISTAIWSLLNGVGLDDLWSCFLMIVIIFASSAWGVYILAGNYVRGVSAAFFAGFAFACSNFMIANIDDLVYLAFVLPCLTLHYFLKFLRSGETVHLKWMAILGGLQAYVSVYTFVLQCLTVMLFALVHVRQWWSRERILQAIGPALMYILIPMPIFAFHLYARFQANVMFPWPTHLVMDGTVLRAWSLFGVLPGNLLYPATDTGYIHWGHVRLMAFMGLGLWALAILSLGKNFRSKYDLVVLALVGAAFSFSFRILEVGDQVFSLPIYYTQEDSLFNFFRVPSRFFFVTGIALSILAASGLESLQDRLTRPKTKTLLVLGFLVFHFLENTPFPLRGYAYEPLGDPPKEYAAFFEGQTGNVLLDLPSTDIAIVPFDDDLLCGFNRELVYMNWQPHHRQHIINGINGYVPSFRIMFEHFVDKVFYEGDLAAFSKLRKYNLTHVVFHKDLVMEKDAGMEQRLRQMPFLSPVFESSRIIIFQVLPQGE